MAKIFHTRGRGDVTELPLADILEKNIPRADRRHEKIRVAIVVDVPERRRHGDLVRERHARSVRDVFEFSPAAITPELAATDLVYEVNIEQIVTIDIGNADSSAVIVMRRFEMFERVFDDGVGEGDATGVKPIRE